MTENFKVLWEIIFPQYFEKLLLKKGLKWYAETEQ